MTRPERVRSLAPAVKAAQERYGSREANRRLENAEDRDDLALDDVTQVGLGADDVLVGLAASGSTPYTVGCVLAAQQAGALTIGIANSPGSRLLDAAEHPILIDTGPEAIAGSTRMKAGTAQKLVLNMLSTVAMIRLGYVTGNRMTNVQTRNVKLRARAERILAAEAGLDEDRAKELLDAAGGDLPVALVMSKTGCSRAEADTALKASRGVLAQAIESVKKAQ